MGHQGTRTMSDRPSLALALLEKAVQREWQDPRACEYKAHRDLGSRIWGHKMGSEGSRLAESELCFSLKMYSICTPHFNRKNDSFFSGCGKLILPPNSGAQIET